jgi:hypothetical protein
MGRPKKLNLMDAREPDAETTEASLRTALAVAIANHAAAEEAHSKATSLAASVWERRAAARENVEAAQLAFEEAKYAIATGTGGASRLRAARDELEMLQCYFESIHEPSDVESSRQRLGCRARLENKLREVVRASPGIRRIIEDFRVARSTFVEKYQLMRSLALASMLPPEAGLWEASVECEGVVNAPLPEPWQRAIEALRRDANAALPEH